MHVVILLIVNSMDKKKTPYDPMIYLENKGNDVESTHHKNSHEEKMDSNAAVAKENNTRSDVYQYHHCIYTLNQGKT